MRQNLERGRARQQRLEAPLFDCTKLTLAGTYVIGPESPTMHFLDAGGAPRFVMLPALSASGGQFYFIMNTGDENLVILRSDGVEIDQVGPATGTFFVSSPQEWQGIQQIATDGDLAAIEALTGGGILVRTGIGANWSLRALIAPVDGFTIHEATGVSGNPTFELTDDLAALEGLGGIGVPRRVAANQWEIEPRRQIATSDLTFWVKSAGNDVSGLDPSVAEPGNSGCYQTWVFAINDVCELWDFNGHTITIRAAGTGVRSFTITSGITIPDWRGGGVLALLGDSSNVDNVRFTSTVQNLITWSNDVPTGALSVDFLRLNSTHADGRAINHRANGRLLVGNIHVFECLDCGLFVNNDGSFFQIRQGCTLQFTTLPGTETGILVDSGRGNTDGTIQFNGGAVFGNTFLEVNFNGWMYTAAFSGTFTGVSYNVKDGGGLRLAAGSIPGSIPGINQPGTCVSDASGVTLSSGDIWSMGGTNGGRLVKTLGTDGRRLEETTINVDNSQNMSNVKSISTTANVAVGSSLSAATTITAGTTLIGNNLQITTTASIGGNATIGGQLQVVNIITTGTVQVGTNLTATGNVTFGPDFGKTFWACVSGLQLQRLDASSLQEFFQFQNFAISGSNQGQSSKIVFGRASASIASASEEAVLSVGDWSSSGVQSAKKRVTVRTSGSINAAVDYIGLGAIFGPTATVPAGGNTELGVKLSATANLGIFVGSSLPSLSAAQGSLYLRTNGRTLWQNTDGSTGWAALPCVLGRGSTSVSHTGNTSETVLATVTLPAAAMGPNGRVNGKCTFNFTNSADSKTLRVRLGGIGGTMFSEVVRGAGDQGYTFAFGFANRNANNSQVGDNVLNSNGFGTHTSALPTGAIDTNSTQTIVITGQLASAGNTISLESFQIDLFPAT